MPQELAIEEFDGQAWVGVIPFWMSHIARRPWPAIPGLSAFPELNVRTYVTHRERPGVWFFSLDAANRLAVWVARRRFHLNYVYARMTVRHDHTRVRFHAARPSGITFDAIYQPTGPVQPAVPGSLPHWLTERYCLYARSPGRVGRLHRAEIHHAPWPLQPAHAAVRRNDLLGEHGIVVGGPPPLAHFAARIEVAVWPLGLVDNG